MSKGGGNWGKDETGGGAVAAHVFPRMARGARHMAPIHHVAAQPRNPEQDQVPLATTCAPHHRLHNPSTTPHHNTAHHHNHRPHPTPTPPHHPHTLQITLPTKPPPNTNLERLAQPARVARASHLHQCVLNEPRPTPHLCTRQHTDITPQAYTPLFGAWRTVAHTDGHRQ